MRRSSRSTASRSALDQLNPASRATARRATRGDPKTGALESRRGSPTAEISQQGVTLHISRRHTSTCRTRSNKSAKCNCDGNWRARLPNPHSSKSNAQIERRFSTKREAEAWLSSQQTSILNGSHLDPSLQQLTFRDLAEAWRSTWRTLEPK